MEPFETCSICLETVSDPGSPPCGHLFCYQCIYKHLESEHFCPLCRQDAYEIHRHAAFGLPPDNITGPQNSQEAVGLFDVVDIIDHRGRGQTTRYLVLWDSGETTWEPIAHLVRCQRALRAYRKRKNANNTQKWRERRRSSGSGNEDGDGQGIHQ